MRLMPMFHVKRCRSEFQETDFEAAARVPVNSLRHGFSRRPGGRQGDPAASLARRAAWLRWTTGWGSATVEMTRTFSEAA